MTQLRLLGRSRSGAQVRLVCYAGGLRQPRHAHDSASVTLVIGGALEENVGRATVSAGAGRVCVKPAGLEHACRFFAPATRTLQVVFPGACADLTIRNGTAWRWLERGAPAAPLLEVLRACRDADAAPARLDDALADAAALFFGAGPAPRREPSWLARVRDALIDSDAPVADIAAREGLHRSYLARAFFRHVGLAPVAFRRTARALRAMDLLVTPRAQADIALASGFADQSHMIRELRAATGYTPARWRAQAA